MLLLWLLSQSRQAAITLFDMIGKVCLDLEFLVASFARELERRKVIALMGLERVWPTEFLLALVTVEQFLVRVTPHVIVELILACKRFRALLTLVRFLARVFTANVSLELIIVGKSSVAIVAHFMMRFQVIPPLVSQ